MPFVMEPETAKHFEIFVKYTVDYANQNMVRYSIKIGIIPNLLMIWF